MRFYSGFMLQNEESLFSSWIEEGEFFLYGFSYGAIKAFEEALKDIEAFRRVDRLVLFSPAFFQSREEGFKKLQLRAFSKNKERYVQNFLNNCFAPYAMQKIYRKEDTLEDLQKLLYYEWSLDDLLRLKERGVVIEVYLGGLDQIIDVQGAYAFFKDVANVTFFKEANHFLQGE